MAPDWGKRGLARSYAVKRLQNSESGERSATDGKNASGVPHIGRLLLLHHADPGCVRGREGAALRGSVSPISRPPVAPIN